MNKTYWEEIMEMNTKMFEDVKKVTDKINAERRKGHEFSRLNIQYQTKMIKPISMACA